MIRGGKGGGRTKTGLKFERRTNLRSVILSVDEYRIRDRQVYFGERNVAELFKKRQLYSELLEKRGLDWKRYISKRLEPDGAILVLRTKILFIIEQKYQQVSGSVDEKLQTCDFKNKQYQKLLAPLGIQVRYVYVLNDWFKKPEYRDVLDYISAVGCHYFFGEIPISFLDLPL